MNSAVEIHLSPLIGERGYDIKLPREIEWKQVIDYIQLFLTFSDEKVGQRLLVHSNVITLGTRETIYVEYMITRVKGGWTRHVSVFFATEKQPYEFHVNMYLEVDKRRGIWRGFSTV